MKKKMNSTFNLLSSFATKVGKKVGNYTARTINKKKEETLTYEQQLFQIIDNIKSILITIINSDESATDDLFQNLELLEKTLQKTITLFFDKQTFNQNSFEILIGSKLIPMLTEYININYINSLTKIIFPYLHKLIFTNEPLSNITEEMFIINNQIIQCIKQLLIEFVKIINEINNIALTQDIFDFIEEGMIPFLNDFVLKLILYQNFYEKISVNNPNFNFDLFDIFIVLFKYEQQIKRREVKSLLRKSLLKIMNFFKIIESEKGIGYYKKLITNSIYNLTEYYTSYLELSNKEIDNSYKLFNDLPLNLTENDILKLNSEDIISYIKFFSLLSYNFSSKNELKEHFFSLLINNFFCENILEEVINLSNDISYQLRSVLLIEYLYYFVKYINNTSIQECIFYFLFGINSEQKNIDEEENISNSNRESTYIGNIKNIFEKSNHNFESIRAFFTMIIESDNTNQFPLLMKMLSILAKKLPYIFMTEIIVPYYLYSLYKIIKSEKDFDNIIDNLIKNKECVDIIEILKFLAPQHAAIDTNNWINYFTKNIKLNSYRSIIILNQMKISVNNQEFINDSSVLNKSDNGINMNYFFGSILNTSNLSFSENNDSILSARLDLNDNNNIDNDIKISEDNKYSYLFNSYIISSRVKFFDTLVKKLKKFVTNENNENLYITEFFMEIASFLPPVGKSGELRQLFNIYAGITYAKKSNEQIFGLSIIGILHNIKCQIDKQLIANFDPDEVGDLCSMLDDPNQKWEDILLLSNEYGVDMYQKLPLLKNVKLYNELIKDFISNIFAKQIIGQSNDFWAKCINKNNKNE